MADQPTNPTKAAAQARADEGGVKVRTERGRQVYTARGVDLFARAPGSGNYTLLRDDAHGNAAGRVMQLCGPDFDHSAACTARDMAAAL